jgi:hypothetical protein
MITKISIKTEKKILGKELLNYSIYNLYNISNFFFIIEKKSPSHIHEFDSWKV